jgi:hypothetical protein
MTTNPTDKPVKKTPVKKTPTVKKTPSTQKLGNTALIPGFGLTSKPGYETMSGKKGLSIKKKMKNGGAMLRQAPKSTMEKISSTKLKDVPEKAKNLGKKLFKSAKDKVNETINKVKNTTVGEATENAVELFTGYNPNRKPTKKADKVLSAMARRNGGKVGKMKNGGSLSGLKASNKRVGPVDPKGAFTKVQKKTLAGAKGKASLTKDKQLGATKMAKRGMSIKKK